MHRSRLVGWGVVVTGTLLIASTYGMARFGVGLFAPLLATQRPSLAPVLGSAAAAQFVSYAVAATLAGRLTDRRPRLGLLLAGVTATTGCLGVVVASTPLAFVAAVFVGGMGAGLASPAMVRVVDAAVSTRVASSAQATVNTGTAFGVIASGGLAALAGDVGSAWTLMAIACAASAAGVLLLSGRPTCGPTASEGAVAGGRTGPRLAAPAVAAVVVGAGSALVWGFGPLLLTQAGTVPESRTGWLWISLGLGGLLGPLTGTLVDRVGVPAAWSWCSLVLAGATVTVAAAMTWQSAAAAFAAMALFGAGYMCCSGVLILVARSVVPAAAGAGTSVLFVALAVGQALGSVGIELVRHHVDGPVPVLVAAGLCLVGGRLLPSSAAHHSRSALWSRRYA